MPEYRYAQETSPEPTYKEFKIILLDQLGKWVDEGWLWVDTWPGRLVFVLIVK